MQSILIGYGVTSLQFDRCSVVRRLCRRAVVCKSRIKRDEGRHDRGVDGRYRGVRNRHSDTHGRGLRDMNKLTTIIVSASVGLVIGMTGVAGASAKPGLGSAKPKYTQQQMNKCAGAVMAADEIISGGDKSK